MKYAQLFVRLVIATGFLSAVADRLGYWGSYGQPGVAWGNWDNFVAYTYTLNPYAGERSAQALAVGATVLEAALGLLLLVGYRTKIAAFCAGVLLILFALAMTLSLPLGIKTTFDYSVWVGAGACLLLSAIPAASYKLSLDAVLFTGKRRK